MSITTKVTLTCFPLTLWKYQILFNSFSSNKGHGNYHERKKNENVHKICLWKDQLNSWRFKKNNAEMVNKKYTKFTFEAEVFQRIL